MDMRKRLGHCLSRLQKATQRRVDRLLVPS